MGISAASSDSNDGLNDALIFDNSVTQKKKSLTVINTNARSLCPKIDSLVDCFEELNVDIAVVTETWLKDGPELDHDLADLELAAGISTLTLNRPPNLAGVAHGGVAVLHRKSMGNFKKIPVPNPDNFEVLPVIGTMSGTSRKIVVIAAYIPPNYLVPRGAACLEYIESLVIDLKNKYRDPYIVIAGDFNQWEIGDALCEFPDLREVHVGPTRGDRAIDRLFCNMTRGMTSSGTVPPLETDSSQSDHSILYMSTELPRQESFEWITYSYRHFNDEAQEEFGRWIITHDWSDVFLAQSSNDKAKAYQSHIDSAMERFFPLRTVRRKSSDLPWINKAIKKKIRRRKKVYRKEGRSELWKYLKAATDKLIKDRKRSYMDLKKRQLSEPDANRSFFRLVKAFNTPEKPQTFDIRTLRPGKTDSEIANELADFFNRISSEFDGLTPDQIPITKHRQLEPLMPHEVAGRIKRFRKPKSMVTGDAFPALLTRFSDFFAIPLTEVFNSVASTQIWPAVWKTEYVTVIPKKSTPESFNDLRNISCTLLVSKIMESYVLEWASQEVAVKLNQFGGVRGCSGGHMILGVWQRILTDLEDRRAATVLTSIDYSKAFNRLSFQHCLKSFAKRGATTPLLKLLATFLTNRSMQVRVGSTWSTPRTITGGCPQGSILGVLLFNMTTDDLEEDSDFVAPAGRPSVSSIGEEESFCLAEAG